MMMTMMMMQMMMLFLMVMNLVMSLVFASRFPCKLPSRQAPEALGPRSQATGLVALPRNNANLNKRAAGASKNDQEHGQVECDHMHGSGAVLTQRRCF